MNIDGSELHLCLIYSGHPVILRYYPVLFYTLQKLMYGLLIIIAIHLYPYICNAKALLHLVDAVCLHSFLFMYFLSKISIFPLMSCILVLTCFSFTYFYMCWSLSNSVPFYTTLLHPPPLHKLINLHHIRTILCYTSPITRLCTRHLFALSSISYPICDLSLYPISSHYFSYFQLSPL